MNERERVAEIKYEYLPCPHCGKAVRVTRLADGWLSPEQAKQMREALEQIHACADAVLSIGPELHKADFEEICKLAEQGLKEGK